MINGNNIFISLDSNATTTPFAATKSNEINTECETIEISSPTIGDWRQYIAGRKEWSFTVGWLVVACGTNIKNSLEALLEVGKSYTITICDRVGSTATARLTGTTICTQARITAARGNIAQGSFSFRGNGALAAPSV